MLGKLFKYDMKSIVKQMLPLWILAPIVALIVGFASNMEDSYDKWALFVPQSNTIMMILMLVFFGIMVAMGVLTILFIIQRFWNGLLGEEGYLMFTLPVKTWQLITSKGLSAILVTCISGLSGALSMLCMAIGMDKYVRTELFHMIGQGLNYLFKEFGAIVIVDFILLIVVGVFGVAKSVYHIYAAMAIGQLFPAKRKLAAGGAFLGIAVLLSVLGSAGMAILGSMHIDFFEYLNSLSMVGHFALGFLIFALIVELLQVVIFHVVTERILDTKLNLE